MIRVHLSSSISRTPHTSFSHATGWTHHPENGSLVVFTQNGTVIAEFPRGAWTGVEHLNPPRGDSRG